MSSPNAHDYYRWEAEYLRASIVSSINETRTLERNSLIGTGAVWTWLATHQVTPNAQIVWWLPMIFALLGWLRARAVLRSIERSAAYIRHVEAFLCEGPGPRGWETHLAQERKPIVSRTMDIFWVCLLLLAIVIPFLERSS
jgi:hypothetical protein